MKKLFGLLFISVLIVSCSKPTDSPSNEGTSSSVELTVDSDNIGTVNNATDTQLQNNYGWYRDNPGNGLNSPDTIFYDQSTYNSLNFNFNTGFKSTYVNGPAGSSPGFKRYFVIRKGSNGDHYLIYYKKDSGQVDQQYRVIYEYCYECYKYYTSEHYLRLETSQDIISEIYNYVQPRM